jgi:hypothetical protein
MNWSLLGQFYYSFFNPKQNHTGTLLTEANLNISKLTLKHWHKLHLIENQIAPANSVAQVPHKQQWTSA